MARSASARARPRACLHVEGRIQAPCTCSSRVARPPGRQFGVTDGAGMAGSPCHTIPPVPGRLRSPTRRNGRSPPVHALSHIRGHSARKPREWEVHIPQAVLAVTVMNADTAALQCALSIHPHPQIFILVFVPWRPHRTEIPLDVTAGTRNALCARCADDNPHGPDRPLPDSGNQPP